MNPAIVVPAYNRPRALDRLLKSLAAAYYPANSSVPLVISIDPEEGGPNQGVLQVAQSLDWQHGPKDIHVHKDHLGLLQNYFFCGDLTNEYDSVIILEDDLLVSPAFYYFVSQAIEYFTDETRLGGFSVYSYSRNGFTHEPFSPLSDGTDIFFMQAASILGQTWTREQWRTFANWRSDSSNIRPLPSDAMHDLWSTFDAEDYFPIVTKYLVATERYFLFPRVSLATGFGDAGTHFSSMTSYFQTPLQYGQPTYRFQNLQTSNSLYDSFMEIKPECLKRYVPELNKFDFDVDLNATKKRNHLRAKHVLSSRPCAQPINTYALAMRPPEANVIFNIAGEGINLCRSSDLHWDRWSEIRSRIKLHAYYSGGRSSSLKRSLSSFLLDLVNWCLRKMR